MRHPQFPTIGQSSRRGTAPVELSRSLIEPHLLSVQYPGGIRARIGWTGSAQSAALFALSEAGGSLIDHGPLVSTDPDSLCRAEIRVDHPGGSWTIRLASPIFDEPRGPLWDSAGLLIIGYGFVTYAFVARSGELRWHHRSGTPLVAVLASLRLDHVLVQAEIETFAIEEDGTVGWRIAHSDVVTEAALIGGRLVLTSFGGQVSAIDPATGRETAT